jgi:hypothetical protein
VLVEVDQLRARPQFVATDAIRFVTERIELGAIVPPVQPLQLVSLLEQQSATWQGGDPERIWLVTWHVAGEAEVSSQLRRPTWASELVASRQLEEQKQQSRVWTIGVEAETKAPEASSNEETFLGDFLRTVRQFEEDGSRVLNLEEFRPHTTEAARLAAKLSVGTADRRRVLRHVAALGIDLLGNSQAVEGDQ